MHMASWKISKRDYWYVNFEKKTKIRCLCYHIVHGTYEIVRCSTNRRQDQKKHTEEESFKSYALTLILVTTKCKTFTRPILLLKIISRAYIKQCTPGTYKY